MSKKVRMGTRPSTRQAPASADVWVGTRGEFVARTTRFERYRFADKSLRFFAYRCMENYVLASFVVSLALPGLEGLEDPEASVEKVIAIAQERATGAFDTLTEDRTVGGPEHEPVEILRAPAA